MYTKTKAVMENRRARAAEVAKESNYASLSLEEKMARNPNRFVRNDKGEIVKIPLAMSERRQASLRGMS